MKLTVKFKILPTKEQEQYLEQTLTEYINTVNNIVRIMINGHTKLASKDIKSTSPRVYMTCLGRGDGTPLTWALSETEMDEGVNDPRIP